MPIVRLPEYLCGIASGYLFGVTKKDKNERNGFIGFSIAEIVASGLIVFMCYKGVSYWRGQGYMWIVPNILLVCSFAYGKGVLSIIARNSIIQTLGDVSFECYMFHQVIINYVVYIANPQGTVSKILVCLYVFVSVIGISLVYNSIDWDTLKNRFWIKNND